MFLAAGDWRRAAHRRCSKELGRHTSAAHHKVGHSKKVAGTRRGKTRFENRFVSTQSRASAQVHCATSESTTHGSGKHPDPVPTQSQSANAHEHLGTTAVGSSP